MRINYINNTGGGFFESEDVEEGVTLSGFFFGKFGEHTDPSDYLILVNNEAQVASYALQEGDRVSISPVGVKGA